MVGRGVWKLQTDTYSPSGSQHEPGATTN